MYEIEKLSRKERSLISDALYPAGIDLEHVWYMLEDVKDLFGPVPHELRDDEAERLWHVISLAESIIFDTLTFFYLTIGDNEWRGVKSFLRSSEAVLERKKEAAFGVGAPKSGGVENGLTA